MATAIPSKRKTSARLAEDLFLEGLDRDEVGLEFTAEETVFLAGRTGEPRRKGGMLKRDASADVSDRRILFPEGDFTQWLGTSGVTELRQLNRDGHDPSAHDPCLQLHS